MPSSQLGHEEQQQLIILRGSVTRFAIGPHRWWFGLLLLTVAVTILWVSCSRLVVPHLIRTAYRGESLPVFNAMISGQAVQPLEHYLLLWNRLWISLLIVPLLAVLTLLGITGAGLFYAPHDGAGFSVNRVNNFIQEPKLVLLGGSIAYLIAAHYWFLGFTSGDGFLYRIATIVELVQHGNLGGEKFVYNFMAQHFYPFFELVHFPFLKLFGLPGL